MKNDKKKNNSDVTVADIMCRWYVCAIIGFAVGNSSGDALHGLIGFAIGTLIGMFLQKLHNKQE